MTMNTSAIVRITWEVENQRQSAIAIADRATNDAVQSLAAAIDTTHEDAGPDHAKTFTAQVSRGNRAP